MQHKGVVKHINVVNAGKFTLYSFSLDEHDGPLYGMGTVEPTFGKGDTVKFSWEMNKKNYPTVDKGSLQVKPGGPAPQAQQGMPATKAKGGGENWDARAKYWEAKEKHDLEVIQPRISYQAAFNQAVGLIDVALKNDAVSIGSEKTAPNKKFDNLLAVVRKTAAEIYLDYLNVHDELPQARVVEGVEPDADFNDDIPDMTDDKPDGDGWDDNADDF
tara:strand:- start:5814 stop:6461 length:648 start_codon:yes stop_codon:yes gene_type:complete